MSNQCSNQLKESCEPGSKIAGSENFVQDLNLVREQLEPNQATYFIHRLDEKDKFLLIAFVPDNAPVRSKMLYASSASGLLQQLGGTSRFEEVIFWTELEEVSPEGWKTHLDHVNAQDPSTEEERALQTAIEHEADQMLGTSGRRNHLDTSRTLPKTSGSVQMQFNESVSETVNQLSNLAVNAAFGLVSFTFFFVEKFIR